MLRLTALCVFLLALLSAQSPSRPVFIAGHRGALHLAPENTIASFEAAASAGADYVETDVRQTADGELVLMHDKSVDRTTNGKGEVARLTLAQIRALDAGQGHRVPTLREALHWARGRGVSIDIDYKDGAPEDIARAIRDSGMTRHVVIEGSRETLTRFAALLPGVATMPKVQSAAEIPTVCASLHTTIVRLSLDQLAQPAYVDAVRQCGARPAVTILGPKTDNEETIRRVIALGAQYIETDYPALVARLRPSAP